MSAASESNFLFPYPHESPIKSLKDVENKDKVDEENQQRAVVLQDENSLRELVKDMDEGNGETGRNQEQVNSKQSNDRQS